MSPSQLSWNAANAFCFDTDVPGSVLARFETVETFEDVHEIAGG